MQAIINGIPTNIKKLRYTISVTGSTDGLTEETVIMDDFEKTSIVKTMGIVAIFHSDNK